MLDEEGLKNSIIDIGIPRNLTRIPVTVDRRFSRSYYDRYDIMQRTTGCYQRKVIAVVAWVDPPPRSDMAHCLLAH